MVFWLKTFNFYMKTEKGKGEEKRRWEKWHRSETAINSGHQLHTHDPYRPHDIANLFEEAAIRGPPLRPKRCPLPPNVAPSATFPWQRGVSCQASSICHSAIFFFSKFINSVISMAEIQSCPTIWTCLPKKSHKGQRACTRIHLPDIAAANDKRIFVQ